MRALVVLYGRPFIVDMYINFPVALTPQIFLPNLSILVILICFSLPRQEWCRTSSVVEIAAQQKIAGRHLLKGPGSLAASSDPLHSFLG